MKVLPAAWRRSDLREVVGGAVGTVGNYDGVHLGQQQILRRVASRARELGRASAVITFEPHPLTVLQPAKAPPRLTTGAQKERLLESHGVDVLVVVEFDRELAATPAREFAGEFLFGRLDLAEIFVGSRFVFGRDRKGDLALLESVARELGRRVEGVAELSLDERAVSSTRIRTLIGEGEVESAAKLLGRPYAIDGVVVRGAGKGKALGWPTINLDSPNELFPRHGVYATKVRLTDGTSILSAVTNVGVRPTLHRDSETVVESFLFDFEGDLYDQEVTVEFYGRLRDEKKFAGAGELVAQIENDAARARELLAEL